MNQFAVLPPSAYTTAELDFTVPRVLELTYTTHDLATFARDCGYDGPPFPWDEERRAVLRAELDAYYASLYGLTRDELRYVLDPSDIYGDDFPGETFRVLKEREKRQYGEYRTRRLVLEAWDRLGLQPQNRDGRYDAGPPRPAAANGPAAAPPGTARATNDAASRPATPAVARSAPRAAAPTAAPATAGVRAATTPTPPTPMLAEMPARCDATRLAGEPAGASAAQPALPGLAAADGGCGSASWPGRSRRCARPGR